jgi:hypothetical protein
MKRHGHDYIEPHFARQNGGKQLSEGPRQGFQSLVFKQMDERSQGAVILAEAKCGIEPGQAATAQPAASVRIEWKRVDERSIAVDTEVFGDQRLWSGKAGGTDWNSGNFAEGGAAHAAVVWKDKVEEGRGKPLRSVIVDLRQSSW